MRAPVWLTLFSGIICLTLASQRLRFFKLLDYPQHDTWEGAKNACNMLNMSLVTLYDKNDVHVIDTLLLPNYERDEESWLGLHKNNSSVSTWSDGAPLTIDKLNVSITNGEQICEAFENNTRRGFNCSDRKAFMCNNRGDYILVENKTTNWCRALEYCRKHFTDLVSISNETQNDQVIEKGKNKTFWIGFMHDEWKWEDNGCSTYRYWSNKSYISQEKCTILHRQLHRQGCSNDYRILCSTGATRIKVIEKNFTWEEAFDYCRAHHSQLLQIEDVQDQKAVQQWLNFSSNVSDTYWIGLRQSHVFGFWIWSDKTVAYDNWKDGRIPEMPMSNNCGVIKPKDNYTWSDENCWYPHPFLCEEDIFYMR